MVETFGTGAVEEACIARAVREVFDLTPGGIIRELGLRAPIYRRTAAYGHFGRPAETAQAHDGEITYFSWERTDRVEALRKAVR
jgi:S-adenosylmethionine synthetase